MFYLENIQEMEGQENSSYTISLQMFKYVVVIIFKMSAYIQNENSKIA